jgi:hypothetical protein
LRDNFLGLVVPSKAYGAFAVGRPVIYQGDRKGEIARLISEKQIGSVVGQSDHQGLIDAIRAYHASPALVRQQGQMARAVAESECGHLHSAERYRELLQQCIVGARR